jgi:hypothetical protein
LGRSAASQRTPSIAVSAIAYCTTTSPASERRGLGADDALGERVSVEEACQREERGERRSRHGAAGEDERAERDNGERHADFR